MSDISHWPDFIGEVTVKFNTDGWGQPCKEYEETKRVLPLNDYQVANMLYMLLKMRKQEKAGVDTWNTGDWFYELLDVLAEYCMRFQIKEITANCAPYAFNVDELQKIHWDLLKYDEMKNDTSKMS